MNNIFCDDIRVLNWWLSSWSHSIQIHTKMWKVYKTSFINQSSFEQLASQNKWDKIREIRISNSNIEDFHKSENISEWLKSKVIDILNINQ